MKKLLLTLFVMLVGNNIHCYSQSADYTKYFNQLTQKSYNMGAEIGKGLQSSSQFAMRSTNKDLYVLYMDGQKVAYFSDEWSCKAQINKIKMQLENAMSNLVKELPREIQREYGNQFRSEMKSNINRMNFTYRKEPNPNYRPSESSDFSNKNNGFYTNETQDYSATTNSLSKSGDTGQIKGSVFSVENQREKHKITSQVKDNNLSNNAPAAVENDFDKYRKQKEGGIYLDDTKGLPSVKPSIETEKLIKWEQSDREMEDRLAQILSKQRRIEDSKRYEQNTPEYQKKIDKYNEKLQWEDLSLSETVDAIAAHTKKGTVILWSKAKNFTGDLITGQAKKEINAVVSSAVSNFLEFATKGRAGKDDVEFIKGLHGGISKFSLYQESGREKIVNGMFGNKQDLEDILRNDDRARSDINEADEKYLDKKLGGTVSKVKNNLNPSSIIYNERDKIIKKEINNMQNGDIKQAAAYLNGVRTEGGGTFWGFYEHKIKSAK